MSIPGSGHQTLQPKDDQHACEHQNILSPNMSSMHEIQVSTGLQRDTRNSPLND